MKPRHAAALALVGWYLMVPPVRQPKGESPYLDEHAEYRDWKIVHTFKSQDDCEASRDMIAKATRRGEPIIFPDDDPRPPRADPAPWFTQQSEIECIATDDPRLKGN
jgi:hypothetical protein